MSPAPGGEWERDVLTRLAFAAVTEQRRARRWNTFFKVIIVGYLVTLLFISLPSGWFDFGGDDKHSALVDVSGVISEQSDASADRIVSGLRAAFEDEDTAGVILRVNSPGGSPVQAGFIYDEIRRLRKLHPKVPLYAVITDICASGCYYIAAAADRIYADKASVVGSIGVIMNGFGFVESMKTLGVERRAFTSGKNKALLDPFAPLREDEVQHVRGVLENIHKQFVAVVRQGRGDRIKDDEQLFSGLIWTGEQGVALGLVDELASAGHVAREVIGAEKAVDFTPRKGVFERLASKIGTSIGKSFSLEAGLGQLQMR
ncbi:MAG: protease-4 [Gammaproteobacteria bacterium]|jgi:protease-4